MAALMMKGYSIVAHRHRTPFGEIDIIARRGATLAIVEVKARPDLATGQAAVTVTQRKRLQQAALAVVSSNAKFSRLHIRFDLIVIRPWRWPFHLDDAWRL